MKFTFIIFLFNSLSILALGQTSYPIFADKKDSAQYVQIQQEVQKHFRSTEGNSVSPEAAAKIDSLLRLQSTLREKVIGFKTIYKSNPDFTSFHDLQAGVVQANEVKKVSLADYPGKKLPKEIIACSELQELELVNTRIKKLPKQLNQTQSLSKVYFYNNTPSGRLKFSRNKQIHVLTIQGTESKHLPKHYAKLLSLQELDLSKNIDLDQFPNITKNNRLKRLKLLENNFTLTDLKKQRSKSLEELNLQKNKIQSLPYGIGNFPLLKKLTCNYNKISTIDPAVSKLTQLEELSFYQNKLASIPAGIYSLASLKTIDLYYNKIKQIEPDIANMQSLEILYLSNNELVSLPENFGALSNLKELYIHNNKISYLPKSMENLTELKILRLNNNYFTSFPHPILNLKDLENLDFSRNNLQHFPKELCDFSKLQILAAVDNPWENKDEATEAAAILRKKGTLVHLNSFEVGVEE
jgi:Leucine-rich repeat (LRR) protein